MKNELLGDDPPNPLGNPPRFTACASAQPVAATGLPQGPPPPGLQAPRFKPRYARASAATACNPPCRGPCPPPSPPRSCLPRPLGRARASPALCRGQGLKFTYAPTASLRGHLRWAFPCSSPSFVLACGAIYKIYYIIYFIYNCVRRLGG